MSALGQKQTFAVQNVMSALPPIADICSALAHVRFVPIADIAVKAGPRWKEFISNSFPGKVPELKCAYQIGQIAVRAFIPDQRHPGFNGIVTLTGSVAMAFLGAV
jgi:hypothetical protein